MKHQFIIVWVLLMFSHSQHVLASENCALPGEVIQWQADYCLHQVGTDDLVAIQPCLDNESARAFKNACVAKAYYKKKLCEAVIASGFYTGSVEVCIADPEFAGNVVLHDGL